MGSESFENAQVEHSISRYGDKSWLRSPGRLPPSEPRHGVAAGGPPSEPRHGVAAGGQRVPEVQIPRQLEQEGICI